MTDTQETQPAQTAAAAPSREAAFVDSLKKMYKEHRGDVAMLKRNAGNTLTEARGVAWFYGFLRRHGIAAKDASNVKLWEERQQNLYFLVATLVPLDRAFLEGRSHFSGDFGKTMDALSGMEGASRDAVERRFRILLDAAFDPDGGGEMAFRLRQVVQLALSRGAGIDWPRLLADLQRWDKDGKPVQKRWARNFYAPYLPPAAAENTADATPENDG